MIATHLDQAVRQLRSHLPHFARGVQISHDGDDRVLMIVEPFLDYIPGAVASIDPWVILGAADMDELASVMVDEVRRTLQRATEREIRWLPTT